MNPILGAGILIGVSCAVWTFIMGLAGWYADPVLQNLFFLVIPLEIAGLVWGLRQTAREGRTYGGQVVAGTMMAIVGGVILICASLLFTTVVFPDYFAEMEGAYRQTLQSRGLTDAQIAEALAANAASATPMNQALEGFLGAFITGIIGSAVIALWLRARRDRLPLR
jgi:hypothetical protein